MCSVPRPAVFTTMQLCRMSTVAICCLQAAATSAQHALSAAYCLQDSRLHSGIGNTLIHILLPTLMPCSTSPSWSSKPLGQQALLVQIRHTTQFKSCGWCIASRVCCASMYRTEHTSKTKLMCCGDKGEQQQQERSVCISARLLLTGVCM